MENDFAVVCLRFFVCTYEPDVTVLFLEHYRAQATAHARPRPFCDRVHVTEDKKHGELVVVIR